LGTLGGGNHFLEVQRVETIFNVQAANVLGLFEGQLTVLIHTGSRGLGHQVCTDYVKMMDASTFSSDLHLPDRQLACAPFPSKEGQAYFRAMNAAANFAFCNRQILTHQTREVFARVVQRQFPTQLRLVYDVAHNMANVEHHGSQTLCVHRKGATRALGPGHEELPEAYRSLGQPVFIPGSMGSASFVLVGNEASAERTFSSTCHGAGRLMSRTEARGRMSGRELRASLEARGIIIKCPSYSELAEEAPYAYKDIERVVDVVEGAQIAHKVARLVPLGVLKG
jgi:tRNA-splicing ligase RtcB